MEKCLTGSEAISGFCAWLMIREEKTVMSINDNTAPIIKLVVKFCKENNLSNPRGNYTDYLIIPD